MVVQKLSYQTRGSFIIIKDCGYNLYKFQRYNDANGLVQKYKGNKINLLTPEVYPHEILDTTEKWHINYDLFPVVSHFKNSLHLDMTRIQFFWHIA